jgi:hypothetical protein
MSKKKRHTNKRRRKGKEIGNRGVFGGGKRKEKKQRGSVGKGKKRKMGQGPGEKGNEQRKRGWIRFGFSVTEFM